MKFYAFVEGVVEDVGGVACGYGSVVEQEDVLEE